ncbi:MAG: glycosyltransferase family 9 protein [Cyanobacteria bacterium RUI128]|nr:glycosyltransferase family 9 protein [Cyanobacteria bacterium RUI128]
MQKKSKKILVIRLGAIGDVVHTTIIPKSIKLKHPDYEIHYLTENRIVPLLENNPYIDKVLTLNASLKRDNLYILKTGLMLFRERYDIVYNLTNAVRNNMLAFMAFPKRIVSRVNTEGSWVEDYFCTAKKAVKDIEIADSLTLTVNGAADTKIRSFLEPYQRPYTIFVPAGKNDKTRQGRIWNIKKWGTLASEILSEYGGTIFVCGGKKEKEYQSAISGKRVILTSGDFSLTESAALLSHADLVISSDTGPVHIASALDVNTLAILGSTSPDKIKPYGAKGHYVSAPDGCRFCWKKKCKHLTKDQVYTPCMERITPEMIMKEISRYNLLLVDDAN